jgi:hypothetical protein
MTAALFTGLWRRKCQMVGQSLMEKMAASRLKSSCVVE